MRPDTEAGLADIIKGAPEPLRIRGGGTRSLGPMDARPVLDTSGLAGVSLYEPGALTLVVKAGTALAEVEAALAAEGQRLAFEPMDHRGVLGTTGAPTIGGAIAAGASGPRRIQAGAARDFMLGVRFVDGSGTVVSNGGRVMKNVTGYDLVKLLTGSWGTLGVLTEVSLKVLPAPEAAASVLIDDLDLPQAVTAMSRALGSPFDVTGAAHVPAGPDGAPVTLLRLEGFAGSVRYRAGELAALYPEFATRIVDDPVQVAQDWAGIRDVGAFHGQPGDVWRLSCRPSSAPDLAARLNAEGLVLDWGGGLIWARVAQGTDLRARLGPFGGHATRVRQADTAVPVFHPEPAPVAAISAALRTRFDPRGILNPGLLTA